jgi:hypothetical protein
MPLNVHFPNFVRKYHVQVKDNENCLPHDKNEAHFIGEEKQEGSRYPRIVFCSIFIRILSFELTPYYQDKVNIEFSCF